MVEKQARFTLMIADLIKEATNLGYQLTFGEAYRPPETAIIYEKQKRGIKNSLHIKRLAVDFNVFKNGKLLSNGEEFKDLGKYWEFVLGGTWGGNFKDGGHFSLEHEGVK
jgi:hypothetical protein